MACMAKIHRQKFFKLLLTRDHHNLWRGLNALNALSVFFNIFLLNNNKKGMALQN